MSAFKTFATRFFQHSSKFTSSTNAASGFRAFSGANVSRTAGSTTRTAAAAGPFSSQALMLLGGGSLLLSQVLSSDSQQEAQCCGIVAYVGNESAVGYLLEGLHILQNRGYDSAGLTTVHPQDEASYAVISSTLHQRNTTKTNLNGLSTPEKRGSFSAISSSPPVPSSLAAASSSSSNTASHQGNFELMTTKYASVGSTSDCIELLKKDAPAKHLKDRCGIAHTRWATHGGKTDENAHPHTDYKGRVALVHNGTIENSNELKQELEATGIVFKSQTDTEVIVQLIGHYLDQGNGILEATKKTLARLEGTWGLAILFKDAPSQVIAARNGSPIVVGIGKNRMFVASEISAFCRHTNQYISLKDGEVAVIHSEGVSLDLSRIEKAPEENIELSPAPFPHWTIKEILEQPEAIARTLNYGGRFDAEGHVKLGGLESNSELLLSIKHLVMSACGTSLFAAGYGERIFRSLRCFDSVQTIDASEVTVDSFPREDGGIVVLSQSGETKDTHRALVTANTLLLPCFSIINIVGSLIARTAGIGVYLNAGREHAVASTKAFTTQVTALALVAGWFSQKRDQSRINVARRAELMESIHRLPIYTGMTLKVHDQAKDIAERLQKKDHLFILGKGYAESIAREGALKIKEITYIHAEGYPGGALKHGPFALLDKDTPVFLLIFSDEHAELMRIAAQEVRARGAHTFIITDKKSLADNIADAKDVIQVPSNGPLTALLSVIPLQLIAYEISILRGINPDKPRHLAKAVTVD